MIALSETLNRMAESWYQRLDDDDKAAAEDILDSAEHFTLGAMPIHEFGRLSSGRMRFVTLLATPREDPRREPLLQAIDALLEFQGLILTPGGIRERSGDPWNARAA